jgi:hypothetical protein
MTPIRRALRAGRKFTAPYAALALTAVGAPVLIAPPAASAYVHEWSCFRYAYEKCYDNSGKTYNPWHVMSFDGAYVGGYCVKGETSSGGVI